jgi:twinkle protein
MAFYGAETKVDGSGKPSAIGFPYGSYSVVRSLPDKAYKTVGDGSAPSLFGKDKFNAGSSKAITICEGAYDAMSIYECLGRKYPAVAVRSASTARSDCVRDYHYLDSFENIYICFDNDTPGMDAAREVAALFPVEKVKHVYLDKYKDANEALQADSEGLRRVWWNARRYQPDGVVSELAAFNEILSKEDTQASASYPFPTLQQMSYGIRSGELILFTALEKVGKTEVLRAIEYHLLKTSEENIGIIHLEEQEKRCVQGLVGYELACPAHLPDSGLSVDDQQEALSRLVKKDGRLSIYSHFGSDDPDDIVAIVRYLAAVGKCKYIFLDHLTMLVTGIEGDDERRKLDYISTKLARLTRELKFTLFLVSHVNDEGQTRGSRMPSKLCDLEVYLSRDKEHPEAGIRNRTNLMVRNNRFGGITGPAGCLTFDPKTFRLEEKIDVATNDDSALQSGLSSSSCLH